MISIKGITKEFKTYDNGEMILRNIDLDIKKGELVTIIGPSGEGKSTFLYILAMLMKPSSGQVYFDNWEVNFSDLKKLDECRRKNIGIVFQNSNLISSLSPVENLTIAMNNNYSNKLKIKMAKDLLDEVGLGKKKNTEIRNLSLGETQMIAVLRALVNNPKLLICDEPTVSLNSEKSKNIIDILLRFKEKNDATLVIATHDMKVAKIGSRRFYLEGGELNELS